MQGAKLTAGSSRSARELGLDRRGGRSRRETAIAALLLLAASVSVLTTLGVIVVLTSEVFGFFSQVSILEFFTATKWTPLFANPSFGIAPLVSGTLLVTFIALLVALPFGLGAAIYLSEFASEQTRAVLMPILEILAGIPTVVFGYFALLFVTPILQRIVPGLNFFNALSAGLVMGFMILPTVSSLSIDAMQAVPRSLREAGYGLGASKFALIIKVIVPAALSGIVAAFILGMSRAVGETMIVTLAAGQRPALTFDPRETIATMTSFIVQAATGDQPAGSLASRSLYVVGAMLFVITLGLNVLSQQVVRRFQEKYE